MGSAVYIQELGCDVIAIQETRPSEQSMFEEAEYTVYCSGESGGESQKKVQGGVGLAANQTFSWPVLNDDVIEQPL